MEKRLEVRGLEEGVVTGGPGLGYNHRGGKTTRARKNGSWKKEEEKAMLAPDLIAVLAYLATGVENAALEDENSPHKAGVLFVDPLFARKVRLLSFFAGHRLMNAEPDAIMADWRRLTVAIQIYCDNIPKESAGIAKPMLQFLGRDSHRLLDEQPRRGEDQHVVEQVPVVRGVVVKGFLKACKDVALNLKLAGHEAEEALDMYDGRAIPAEEVGWNDLRSLSTAVSAEVAKPNGSTGAPFFFNPAIVSGLFKLCHGRIVDIDEYGKQRFAFADLHSRIQTGLLQLVAGVAEAAGFAIEKEGDETRVKAKGCNGSEILERVWDAETEKTERVESQREDGFATSSLFFPEASVEDARNARGLFADRRGNWVGDAAR